jgi:molybdate transport system substrate-binding protein
MEPMRLCSSAIRAIPWAALMILLLCGRAASCTSAEITVFAAASLTDALQAIGSSYQKSAGEVVHFNFAASSVLARQIAEGAPADLFLSADEEKMDRLQARGLIDPKTRHALLSNRLVVIVPADSKTELRNAADLLTLKRIALAETRTVPAGIYARHYLEAAGVWNSLREKIIPTENVRAALAAVAAGNADAAIVYKTDAAISRQVKIVFEVSADASGKIVYPVAVVTDSKHRAASEAFLKHLLSPDAAKVFAKFGFIVLPQ